jgi:hypothetical protein
MHTEGIKVRLPSFCISVLHRTGQLQAAAVLSLAEEFLVTDSVERLLIIG